MSCRSYDVYAALVEPSKQGVSILLISSDMEEIIELADRVHQGRINHEFKEEIRINLMSAAFVMGFSAFGD